MKWFAGCDLITRMGPYRTQLEAWNGLVLTDKEQARLGRVHPVGAYVWPEEVQKVKPKRRSK